MCLSPDGAFEAALVGAGDGGCVTGGPVGAGVVPGDVGAGLTGAAVGADVLEIVGANVVILVSLVGAIVTFDIVGASVSLSSDSSRESAGSTVAWVLVAHKTATHIMSHSPRRSFCTTACFFIFSEKEWKTWGIAKQAWKRSSALRFLVNAALAVEGKNEAVNLR